MMANPMVDSVRFYRSRWTSLKLVLASLLFVVIGLAMIAWGGVTARVVGGLAVAFFGLCGAYVLTEMLWRRPSVELDRGGIRVRSHLAAAGYLPWAEVTGAVVYEMGGQRMLGIEVRDREDLIARATPLRRFVMRSNRRLGYPLVNIPQTAVADDLDDVLGCLRRFRPDIDHTAVG
jgi:hypothetical protein